MLKLEKPILLSTGMSSFDELDQTINFLKNYRNEVSILQCTTSYPTNPKEWGLNVIKELKKRYKIPVGFSDHSGDIYACLSATALGAEILEFHAVFDKKLFGPDSKASLTIEQISNLVKGVHQIKASLNNPVDKTDNSKFSKLKEIFEKSLSINKYLPRGAKITFEDLEAKKPSNMGMPAKDFRKVLGKKLIRNRKQWDFLSVNDFE